MEDGVWLVFRGCYGFWGCFLSAFGWCLLLNSTCIATELLEGLLGVVFGFLSVFGGVFEGCVCLLSPLGYGCLFSGVLSLIGGWERL